MLFNKTSNKKVTGSVRHARTFSQKALGLMFEKREKFNYALVFHLGSESRVHASIHMLFVFFPICAVFLDSERRVVDKVVLSPFQLNYTPKKKAAFIVELPVKKAPLAKAGDILEW